MDRKVILIGGMPTAGKSTVTKALSRHFNIPWISTDQIREIMLSAVNKNDKSKITPWAGYSAEEYLTALTASEIAKNEYASGVATWPGVEAIIHKNWVWRDGFILEGVGIIPEFAAGEQLKNSYIESLFLSDSNTERTREVIFSRGLFGDPSDYSDSLKEKEVEWVYLFDEIIRKEAELYNLPVIEVNKNTDDVQNIIDMFL